MFIYCIYTNNKSAHQQFELYTVLARLVSNEKSSVNQRFCGQILLAEGVPDDGDGLGDDVGDQGRDEEVPGEQISEAEHIRDQYSSHVTCVVSNQRPAFT